MKVTWHTEDTSYENILLAGDIGGTNTNLAIVGKNSDKFTIIVECVFDSHKQVSLIEPVRRTLETAGKSLHPSKCCISAAGPVKDNICNLTNQSWSVNGNDIAAEFSIPTIVVNDFLGLSYGVPLLDVNDPSSITKLPAQDGSFPEKQGSTCAIVGAGTGLGVGCVTQAGEKLFAIPTEGGHIDFAPFDEESAGLVQYLFNKNNVYPDAESLVSGQGLNNILDYYSDTVFSPMEESVNTILNQPRLERPPLISKGASSSRQLKQVMDLFIKCYARAASNLSLAYLAAGGVYLAGGIATKNESLFIEDDLFISHFIMNMRPEFRKLLSTFPVYIVRDYSTSLLGAANAADILL